MRSRSRCALLLVLALAASVAQSRSATLILLDGRIWTENPKQPESEAIAIEGNRIIAVGSSDAIRKLAAPDCRVIDLGGRRVLPGFNDAHVHLFAGGASLISVQLADANSADEFRRRIRDYARSLPKGTWIRDGIWDHQRWTPAELPRHELIDDVTPDNPVFVWRLDGHMGLANALAMKLAGLDHNTKDVPGGEIVRDEHGNPTGVLKDQATALVERVMPPPSDRERDAALDAALHEAASHGVTSVQNMWDSPAEGWVPEQRITVAQAVHAYTVGSAFAEHQEQVKGSLEPGKLADLVVLTEDIFRIPATNLDKVRIYMTVFDGTVLYKQSASGSR